MKAVRHLVSAAPIQWARLIQSLQWPGVLGLALLPLAFGVALHARFVETSGQDIRSKLPMLIQPVGSASAPLPSRQTPALPMAKDTPAILRGLQHTLQTNGLQWTAATYRYNPITDETLASLTIETALRGPYLKIRKSIGMLLEQQHAMTLREFSLTRPNVDASDVEAKVQFVVYLSDGWQPTPPGANR